MDRSSPALGNEQIELIIEHVHTQAPAPSAFTREPIPESFERLVLACLEKAPQDRPADATTLLEQLEACAIEPAWTQHRAERWWREQPPHPTRILPAGARNA